MKRSFENVIIGDYNNHWGCRTGNKTNIPLLVSKMVELGARDYMHIIWTSDHGYDDAWKEFKDLAEAFQKVGIRLWMYMTPPSECWDDVNKVYVWNQPFGGDYFRWAKECSELAKDYPIVSGMVMDDFQSNFKTFTLETCIQLKKCLTSGANHLKFLPLVYYDAVCKYPNGSDQTVGKYIQANAFDGLIFAFLNADKNAKEWPWDQNTEYYDRFDEQVDEFSDYILAHSPDSNDPIPLIVMVYASLFYKNPYPDNAYLDACISKAKAKIKQGKSQGVVTYLLEKDRNNKRPVKNNSTLQLEVLKKFYRSGGWTPLPENAFSTEVTFTSVSPKINVKLLPIGSWQDEWRILTTFTIEKEIKKGNASSIENIPYLLLYRAYDGMAYSSEIKTPTYISESPKAIGNWDKDWSIIEPFVFKGSSYLLFYRKINGEAYYSKIEGSTQVTSTTSLGTWYKKWEIIKSFVFDSSLYFLFYAAGNTYITKADELSSINEPKYWYTNWPINSGVTQIIPMLQGNSLFFFLYKKEQGALTLVSMTSPWVIKRFDELCNLEANWKAIIPFQYDVNNHLFFYR